MNFVSRKGLIVVTVAIMAAVTPALSGCGIGARAARRSPGAAASSLPTTATPTPVAPAPTTAPAPASPSAAGAVDSQALDKELDAMQKELDSLQMPSDADYNDAAGAVY